MGEMADQLTQDMLDAMALGEGEFEDGYDECDDPLDGEFDDECHWDD
jgi:hypothetical protein